MGLGLARALRLGPTPPLGNPAPCSVAFVGAGGKSTAMFQLARQLAGPVIVTTTTHLGAWQVPPGVQHFVLTRVEDLPTAAPPGITVMTGPAVPAENGDTLERLGPVSGQLILWLHDNNPWNRCHLLVEADGAHRKPLKAPVAYEPVIPPNMGIVVVVAGLSGLGKPLSSVTVHRPEQFGAVSKLKLGDVVTPDALVRLLTSDDGGRKGILPGMRSAVLLNQADTGEQQARARSVVPALLKSFDAVLIASLEKQAVHAVHERAAGIVLAAGGSTRLGHPKAMLDWRGQPFVRAVAQTALGAGLEPVAVVTGSDADAVRRAVGGLPVRVVFNGDWEAGQSTSIGAGLRSIPDKSGAAVFLLADQPQIGSDLIGALIDRYATSLAPIVAPLVMMERRGNPVLFDRVTFPDLLALKGDVGGRAVFSKHRVEYVPWYDERILLDVDTQDDYKRLLDEDPS